MAKKEVKRRTASASRAKKSPSKTKPVIAAELARDVAQRLTSSRVTFAHGTTDAVAEAAFIIGETLGRHPDHIETTDRVTAAQVARIRALVGARITTRKPAAYLLNKIYMRGVPFYIDERAIVPRSYIGELLDERFANDAGLLDPAKVTRVLDLCTGSGCLAILAARAFPNATIDAVELSIDALDVARRNVGDHKLADRITLYQGDLFAPLLTPNTT
jgi:ribosomal protein L3 glutamine methyltransferase